MKINRKLNLVIPIETENYGKVFVHSTSVSRDIFEQYYAELGKVFSQCFDAINESHLVLSAPQLAYPALKAIAKKSDNWDGVGGIKQGLIGEITRLTNVVVTGESGWETIPFDSAIKRDILNDDEEAEILSSIVFFTAISKVAPKDLKNSFLEMAAALRNWELLSLDFTEYKHSLPILTTRENIGETVTGSSIAF